MQKAETNQDVKQVVGKRSETSPHPRFVLRPHHVRKIGRAALMSSPTGNSRSRLAARHVARIAPNIAKLASADSENPTMVEEVDRLVVPGHHFSAGPFLLDLYRLLSMVLGDKRLAKMEEEEDLSAFEFLRGDFLDSEVLRILVATSTALRILIDQQKKSLGSLFNKNCGVLHPQWPRKTKQVLTLREACNKIIHAEKLNRDVVDPAPGRNPDQLGVYLLPHYYLYGTRDGQKWRAKLSIIDYAKWGAKVFYGLS